MWCDKHFAAFNKTIRLDAKEKKGYFDLYDEIIGLFSADNVLNTIIIELPFLHGSFATSTVIKSLSNSRLDLDIICPCSINQIPSSKQTPIGLRDLLASRFEQNELFRGRISKTKRIVRIQCENKLQVDLLPAIIDIPDKQPYAIPTRDMYDWEKDDPRGIIEWVRHLNCQSGHLDEEGNAIFSRCVRMFKKWRDVFLDNSISSIFLLTLLGNHEPSSNSSMFFVSPNLPFYGHDSAYLYDFVSILHARLEKQEFWKQSYLQPYIKSDSVIYDIESEAFQKFRESLGIFYKYIRLGVNSYTQEQSLYYFQRAFGSEFPRLEA